MLPGVSHCSWQYKIPFVVVAMIWYMAIIISLCLVSISQQLQITESNTSVLSSQVTKCPPLLSQSDLENLPVSCSLPRDLTTRTDEKSLGSVSYWLCDL